MFGLFLGHTGHVLAQDEEFIDLDAEIDTFEDVDFSDTSGEEENFNEDFTEEFGEEDVASDQIVDEQKDLDEEMKTAEPEPEEPQPFDDLQPLNEPEGVVTDAPAEDFQIPQIEEPSFVSGNQFQPPNDEPDLNYEARLHDIFLNFNSSKTPDAEWDTLVGSRHSERYQIQRGDSLWDISKTLFGDGNYWPKVWSLNSNIKNPHLISPNNSIRFLLGDESEPPAFTVTENAAEGGVPVPNDQAVGDQAITPPPAAPVEDPEPEIPPPLRVSRPVVKKLPPSLPEWQDVAGQGNYDKFGISYSRRKIADVEDSIPLQSYISESAPDPLGVVKEIEIGNNIASAYQYIYVSMKKGEGNIGDTYLAVASRGPIESVNKTIKGFLGYTIDIQGEVQLVERVESDSDSNSGDMYRALVLKIVNPVGVGSVLVPGKIENIQLTEQGPRSQVVAQVIGGSYFNRRQIYSAESIAYINRGENDGLEVGQILPVRANRRVRNEDSKVLSNIRPIGWLRVVRTTPNFATTVVVQAWSDIISGDITGSGEILPQMGLQSAESSVSTAQGGSLEEELDDNDVDMSGADEFDEDLDF
ncbi:MAG: LysM peptidoglycan-binding domain-containing protein [Bdellovibrionales bacterium]|nr:LysM peptidoglycan-binding domain-containing protein [Bdellovibrionales bacterium]